MKQYGQYVQYRRDMGDKAIERLKALNNLGDEPQDGVRAYICRIFEALKDYRVENDI